MSHEFPLRRYLAFAAAEYYPDGGFGDFKGSADDLEGAQALALADHFGENAEVVDQQTGARWRYVPNRTRISDRAASRKWEEVSQP